MSHRLRFTAAARADLERLYRFLAEQDLPAAEAALLAIDRAWGVLREFPFSMRKIEHADPFLRELLIPFGGAGYVVLYRIDDSSTLTILAVRHQRESDYH